VTRIPSTLSRFTLRRAAMALAVSAALTLGYVVRVVHAHDVRLDDAMVALQKAEGLVLAAQTDPVPPQAQHEFDRRRERAVRLIERAMEQIVLAGDAVDNP
jgi:hypothetical protein